MPRPQVELKALWGQFYEWRDRYIAQCDVEIERLAARRDGWKRDTEFLTEQKLDFSEEQDVDIAYRKSVIRQRAKFLKVYFRDLSHGGAASLKRHMRLLPMQLPLRKRTGIGVWLAEDMERKNHGLNASTEFLEPYVSLFAKDAVDIDFASAHSVLPFNYLFLRNFTGKKWTKRDERRISDGIKNDLEFDGMEFVMKTDPSPDGLALTFTWDPNDLPYPLVDKDLPMATKKAVSKVLGERVTSAEAKRKQAKPSPMKASPKQNVARVRGARRDASIGAITKRIQKAFKLPEGSVKLVLPTGKKAHVDGRIKNLLAQWDDA
jgi:hypothetical protein